MSFDNSPRCCRMSRYQAKAGLTRLASRGKLRTTGAQGAPPVRGKDRVHLACRAMERLTNLLCARSERTSGISKEARYARS